jgi:DNA polymerase III subunit delta'
VSVWASLVGQQPAIKLLSAAASGHGLTQAWLFTGPPGSGRSNAALAFAAALQCEAAGCGECHTCRTVLAQTHGDLTVLRTEKLSIGVEDIRQLVRHAALAPTGKRWQIMIIEDADRLTDPAANALLKAIEEPTERTLWLLCAPTVEDVLPTIRSRCRLVTLVTPRLPEVAKFLQDRHGVPSPLATYAARVSEGHIGRAKALATNETARNRRREVVEMPLQLTTLGAAMTCAANLAELAKEEAEERAGQVDHRERAELAAAFGVVERGRKPREYAPALAALERAQKTRAKRLYLDVVDRGLMDLISVYRDLIALTMSEHVLLVNEEQRGALGEVAARSSSEAQLRRIDHIFAARQQLLEFNVSVPLALESMMCALYESGK